MSWTEAIDKIATAAKEKARKILFRASIVANVLTLSAVLLITLAAHKGWIIAQFIPPAMAIGGPAEMEVASANRAANQASRQMQHNSVKAADAGPLPQRSPLAVQ